MNVLKVATDIRELDSQAGLVSVVTDSKERRTLGSIVKVLL